MPRNRKNTESLSLLTKKIKIYQLMQLHTKNYMNCSPHRKKWDSWKPRLNNVMKIQQKRRRQILHRQGLLLLLSMKELILINQLLNLTLALTYFYCCSTDPCVAIFNDELQQDVDRSIIWNHISNLTGSPIGQEEAMLW